MELWISPQNLAPGERRGISSRSKWAASHAAVHLSARRGLSQRLAVPDRAGMNLRNGTCAFEFTFDPLRSTFEDRYRLTVFVRLRHPFARNSAERQKYSGNSTLRDPLI